MMVQYSQAEYLSLHAKKEVDQSSFHLTIVITTSNLSRVCNIFHVTVPAE